jgi:hypothetical protein
MPPQPDPIRLTDAHRAAQSRIATDTVRALLAAFRLLDPDRIDATIDRWLSVAVPIIGRQRATSARLAGNYLSTLRAIELGMTARAFTPVLEDVGIEERVVKSLIVTGPATVKLGHERGLSAAKIFDVAASKMAAAGVRHALETGDHTLLTNHSVEVKGSVLGVQARVLHLLFFRLCHYVLGRFFSTIVMST